MNKDCGQCGGSRLMMGGWMGPTPAAPYPEPCPRCSPNLSPRERQVLQHSWLLDNQHRDDVKEILSRMAVFNAQKYRLVLHMPYARGVADVPGSLTQVRDADMVICAGNMVTKDRYGPAGYVLSDNEVRRIKDSAEEYRKIQ